MKKEKLSQYENPFNSFYLSEQFVKETESIINKGLMSPEIFNIPDVRALITEPVNHFVVGVPGSGKTMALAFLTVESLAFIHSKQDIKDDYKGALDIVSPGLWGIYHGLYLNDKLLVPHDFQGFGLEKNTWAEFFGDFVNYNLLRRMITHLKLSVDKPSHYIPQWLNTSDKTEGIEKSISTFSRELGLPVSCQSLDGLAEWCKNRLLQYQKMIKERRSLNIEASEFPAYPIIKDIGYLPIKLVEQLRENGVLDYQQRVCFIIDEYDQCELSKKPEFARLINNFVKATARANISNINVKVGTRPHGFYEKRVFDGDTKIEKDRDYHEIDLSILRKEKNSRNFSRLITDIANRRMRNCSWFSDRDLVDFKSIIDTVSHEKEADLYVAGKNVRDSHFRTLKVFLAESEYTKLVAYIKGVTEKILLQKYLIIEACRILNKLKPHHGISAITEFVITALQPVSDYFKGEYIESEVSKIRYKIKDIKEPALFQLANDYKQQKYYYGIDTIIMMSEGILLSFIKICSALFKEIGTKTTIFERTKKIDIRWQNRAIRDVSMSTRYDFSRFLTYGQNIQLFIDELGFVFRAIQLIPTAPYPTPNGISVDKELGWIVEKQESDTPEMDQLKMMLKEATDWGYLFEASHRSKSGSLKNRTKYYLNGLLVPYFDLSPKHLKEPIYLPLTTLSALASTDQAVRAKQRKVVLDSIRQASSVVNNGDADA